LLLIVNLNGQGLVCAAAQFPHYTAAHIITGHEEVATRAVAKRISSLRFAASPFRHKLSRPRRDSFVPDPRHFFSTLSCPSSSKLC
jgi:hypothetical protein